jgi:hypothetical protein
MKLVENYVHRVASHCESGTLRNLLHHAGLTISEPMIFGLGSGPAFYYLFFAKGPSTFPLVAIRNYPGSILKNMQRLCGIDLHLQQFKTTDEAVREANALLDAGVPVAVSVDMFYMKYLPNFLHVHAPFHFILLIGRDDGTYAVSDPYFENTGQVTLEDLRIAWAPNAPLAKDNFLAYVRGVPAEINWKAAVVKAIRRTCKDLVLPPGVRRAMFFIGVQGMRTYAKKMRQWADRYRGVNLREGIIFNAIGFEDQGTGGAAFRLMYGAFLQEAAALFDNDDLRGLAQRMIEHGQEWRKTSRRIIEIAKDIPIHDDEYPAWFADHGARLNERLAAVSDEFLRKADFEQLFFGDLRRLVNGLKTR